MSLLERAERASRSLKVFPLASVVLFPGTGLPLHIFEPRYREMVRDALGGDQVIAMAQPEPSADPTDPSPRLRPLCCVGVIAFHEALPDGRSNIVLQGVARARLLEELSSGRLYRTVGAQVLPDAPYSGPEVEQLRQALLELGGRLPTEVAQGLLQVAAHAEGGALADAVASAVVPDLERRYELLAELDVGRRLRGVLSDVGEVMARLSAAPGGPLN